MRPREGSAGYWIAQTLVLSGSPDRAVRISERQSYRSKRRLLVRRPYSITPAIRLAEMAPTQQINALRRIPRIRCLEYYTRSPKRHINRAVGHDTHRKQTPRPSNPCETVAQCLQPIYRL